MNVPDYLPFPWLFVQLRSNPTPSLCLQCSLLRVVTSLKLLLVAAPVTARHRHQGARGHAGPRPRHHRDHQDGGDDQGPAIGHPWHGGDVSCCSLQSYLQFSSVLIMASTSVTRGDGNLTNTAVFGYWFSNLFDHLQHTNGFRVLDILEKCMWLSQEFLSILFNPTNC